MIDVPLNEILEKLSKGIGNLTKKLDKFMHSGMVADFWDWVDKKWYRSDLHDARKG